ETKAGKEPWEGAYRFEFLIQYQSAKDLEAIKRTQVFDPDVISQLFQQACPWAHHVSVSLSPPKNPNDMRYLVDVEGSADADHRDWVYEPSFGFGVLTIPFQQSLVAFVNIIVDDIIGTFGAGVIMLLSTIITAFFIPNMLRKGTIDMLLAKPIHRTTLLVM